jgi:hypothetical protein
MTNVMLIDTPTTCAEAGWKTHMKEQARQGNPVMKQVMEVVGDDVERDAVGELLDEIEEDFWCVAQVRSGMVAWA